MMNKIWLKFLCFIGLHKWDQFGSARRCQRCLKEQVTKKIDIWVERSGNSEFMDFHYINKVM